jgi:hypothetical protein
MEGAAVAPYTFHSASPYLPNYLKKRPPLLSRCPQASTRGATVLVMSVSAYFFLRVAFFFLLLGAALAAAFLRLFLAIDITSLLVAQINATPTNVNAFFLIPVRLC